MQTFEVIDKELSNTRLTVAKDRITLKVLPSTSQEEKERYIRLSKVIGARLGEVEFTMRGTFGDEVIIMAPNSKNARKEFSKRFILAELIS